MSDVLPTIEIIDPSELRFDWVHNASGVYFSRLVHVGTGIEIAADETWPCPINGPSTSEQAQRLRALKELAMRMQESSHV
jgi:hypothetical protein